MHPLQNWNNAFLSSILVAMPSGDGVKWSRLNIDWEKSYATVIPCDQSRLTPCDL